MSETAVLLHIEAENEGKIVAALTTLANLAAKLGEREIEVTIDTFPKELLKDEELGILLIQLPVFGWYSEKIDDGTFLEKLTQEDVDDLIGMRDDPALPAV